MTYIRGFTVALTPGFDSWPRYSTHCYHRTDPRLGPSQWEPCYHVHSTLLHLIITVNTLGPGRNRRHFADDIFKCIFLNGNVWVLIQILLKFVPKGPINNIPALVQIMAWRLPGDKTLPEPTRTTRMPASWDTPRRPMLTHTSDSHQIPSQNTKSKLQIVKNCQNFKFWNFARNFAYDTLKLLDQMYKYEMDPTRTVEATKRTRDAGRTRDGRRTNELTDRRSETNIPPNNFVVLGV